MPPLLVPQVVARGWPAHIELYCPCHGASLVRFLPREVIENRIAANRVRRRYHGDSLAEPATFCGLYMAFYNLAKLIKCTVRDLYRLDQPGVQDGTSFSFTIWQNR
jgi:hypothetical protein